MNETLAKLLRKLYGIAETGATTYAGSQQPYTKEQAQGMLSALADFTPVVGDVKSAYDGIQAAKQGDYLGVAGNAVGLLPFVPAVGGVLKGSTTKAMEDYIKRSRGGVEVDSQSMAKFSDEAAPLSGKPYGQRHAEGEYNARPKEVLIDEANGIKHFAEEKAQKDYIEHRFVKERDGDPVSVLRVIEFPGGKNYWGDVKPRRAQINYGYTKESNRGEGLMSELIKAADKSFPVALEPDFWSSPAMIKAYKRAME